MYTGKVQTGNKDSTVRTWMSFHGPKQEKEGEDQQERADSPLIGGTKVTEQTKFSGLQVINTYDLHIKVRIESRCFTFCGRLLSRDRGVLNYEFF